MNLRIYLYEYLYRKQFVFDNDIIQLYNNISIRKADAVDHLEMIIALSRKTAAEEIFGDIYKILLISREETDGTNSTKQNE